MGDQPQVRDGRGRAAADPTVDKSVTTPRMTGGAASRFDLDSIPVPRKRCMGSSLPATGSGNLEAKLMTS